MIADLETLYWSSNEIGIKLNKKDCCELTDMAPERARKSFQLYQEQQRKHKEEISSYEWSGLMKEKTLSEDKEAILKQIKKEWIKESEQCIKDSEEWRKKTGFQGLDGPYSKKLAEIGRKYQTMLKEIQEN